VVLSGPHDGPKWTAGIKALIEFAKAAVCSVPLVDGSVLSLAGCRFGVAQRLEAPPSPSALELLFHSFKTRLIAEWPAGVSTTPQQTQDHHLFRGRQRRGPALGAALLTPEISAQIRVNPRLLTLRPGGLAGRHRFNGEMPQKHRPRTSATETVCPDLNSTDSTMEECSGNWRQEALDSQLD
jgi:hypothetical protein